MVMTNGPVADLGWGLGSPCVGIPPFLLLANLIISLPYVGLNEQIPAIGHPLSLHTHTPFQISKFPPQ